MIKISLIVPTFNRADLLNKSLKTFTEQTLDASLYEIIIVDNNSTDHTRGVAESFIKSHPLNNWIYFNERKKGLHNARNRGLLLSHGNIVVFGDDDIQASSGWLEAILSAFNLDPRIGIVGGPIHPMWEGDPPEWVFDYGTRENHPIFACLSHGKKSREIKNEDVYGCNFAIKRDLAILIGGSPPDTFPPQMIHYSGTGETSMLRKVRENGHAVYYASNALVLHHVSEARYTIEYFILRYKRWAVEAIYDKYNRGISLYRIGIQLLVQTCRSIRSLMKGKLTKNKINKSYFRRVQTHFLLSSWSHFTKLLMSDHFRTHTIETNHIQELDRI